MRDIIHIGYPRTASTWFQNNLFPKVQNYTFITRNVVQENLIHPLPGSYRTNWHNDRPDATSPILLSEEMITGKIRAGSSNLHFLEIFANRIKETFNNPLVVIFIRRQPDIIYSFYNLYIKKGGTFSLSKFLRQDISLQELLLFSKWFFCYDIALQILTNILGKEAVKIFLYEDFASNPITFTNKFVKELDLKIATEDLNFERLNASYTQMERRFKRIANCFTSEGIPFKHYYFNLPHAYRVFREGSEKESRLPDSFIKQISTFYPEFIQSNQKLLQDYDIQELIKFNYPL